MSRTRTMHNILMELRKVCQHPYLSAPELEDETLPEEEQQKRLVESSGKLAFLKVLLPKLKERGHRILLFSQFKIALDRIEDFLFGEGYKFLRLDGDVQQAQRQKSMDAFNAPDSDYFIFLLTTRAGGVGINLATADTVIVYDPDFNPHMDLQAIARSHRYGQTKKVLVFKLMTKNSVEEKIVWAGKKKMVLDHLVVQQMGKENEEGEIDNMLLHGAAALYDTNEQGVSASDIHYSSEDIDAMIDGVEAEADAQAAALADGNGETAAKAKESMSFGFARIWEADQKKMQDEAAAKAADEGESEMNEEEWERFLASAREAKAEAAKREAERGRKARAAMKKQSKYVVDPVISDEGSTPQKPKKRGRPPKGKGKGKEVAQGSDGDGDFDITQLQDAGDESEGTGSVRSVPDRLDLADVAPKEANGELSRRRKRKSKDKQAEAVGQVPPPAPPPAPGAALAAVSSEARNGPPIVPDKKPEETREERKYRHSQKRKYIEWLRRNLHNIPQAGPSQTPGGATVIPSSADVEKLLARGQDILLWLYSHLCEFGLPRELEKWGLLGLNESELSTRRRRLVYLELAKMVDDRLRGLGQVPFFAEEQQVDNVVFLLASGRSVIPGAWSGRVPELPKGVGRGLPTTVAVPQLPHYPAGPSDPPPRTYSNEHSNSTGTKHLSAPNSHRTTPVPPLQPIARPAAAVPVLQQPDATPSSAPHTAAPLRVVSRSRPASPRHRSTAAAAECPCCKGAHALKVCPEIPEVKMLVWARQTILSDKHASGHDKAQGLRKLDDMLAVIKGRGEDVPHDLPQLGAQAGGAPMESNIASSSFSSLHTPTPKRPRPRTTNGNFSSQPHYVIVIDDDSDGDLPPGKRIKVDGERSPNQPGSSQPKSPGRSGRHFLGCPICGSKRDHASVKCPIVTAGSASIKLALQRIDTHDPMWPVLRKHYQQHLELERAAAASQLVRAPSTGGIGQPGGGKCVFCEQACGRGVRECAEQHGGRKVLKAMVRGLQKREDGEEIVGDRLAALYEAYLAWPKEGE